MDGMKTPRLFKRLPCLLLRLLLLVGTPWGALAEAPVPDDENGKLDNTPQAYSVRGAPSQDMGKELKVFSESVASRIDRIVKKKSFDLWGDPWTVQGVPLIFPTSGNGFNLGIRAAIQNIRRQDPHKLELEAQILASDVGRYKHFVKIDYPRAFDGRFRVTGRLGYDQDPGFRYFGIGNEIMVDQSRINSTDPLYQNTRSGPNFSLQVLRAFTRNLRVGPIMGLKWTEVGAPTGSLLAAEQPAGIVGGRTHYLGIAMVHDTTDFEPYPSRGKVNELFLYWYAPFMGSEYNFFRFTYTFRQFYPLHRELIFGYRLLFESLSGDVPFYELGAVGGTQSSLGFGGGRFLRGWDENRFIDRLRLVVGAELRWDPLEFEFAKQEITLGFVPFIDVGRVWPSVFPLRLGDWHASLGYGMRLIWNNRFIIRTDVALNGEGAYLVVELGSSF